MRHHTGCKWVLLYLQRWLEAPVHSRMARWSHAPREHPKAVSSAPCWRTGFYTTLSIGGCAGRIRASPSKDTPTMVRHEGAGTERKVWRSLNGHESESWIQPRWTWSRRDDPAPCCTRDEGGPLEAAVQAEASNHPLRLRLRDVVVSELGKGKARPCQVRTVESNASESLMKCRKRRDEVKTGRESLARDKFGRCLLTAQTASGIEAARTRSRLLCGTWEPVTPMLREPHKWRPHECLSTDAGYRGGATRSSGEGSVMGLERRGCLIRLEPRVQPVMGGRS